MKFGQYELLERVAVGGMAEVYRGRVAGAEGFEKSVAIKRILPEFARDDRFISMMLTEARIHSALSHGNIVQIHDLGISEDGEYFIVLEYVEGHDLRAVMEAAADLGVQIPDSLALHVADELAQALHFAHELTDAEGQPLGIIHRDVSPSNVLISNSGEVKLSDFGIAKRRHDHSFVGSLKGNLVYMSPEQAQRVSLDRRTDVFSLGAVLFEMLTGQKLRDITDEVNGFREVASGAVRTARALRPDLPEPYEALLSRALAANPADRFPDAAAFGAAIRALRRENDAPVGPADMKELVELLNPPRRARSPVERSKVIRLGPEFKALAGPARSPRAGGIGDTRASLSHAAPGMVPSQATPSPAPPPSTRTVGAAGSGSPRLGLTRAGAAARDAISAGPRTPPPPPLVLSPPASVRHESPGTSSAATFDDQATPLPSPARPAIEVTPVVTLAAFEASVAALTAAESAKPRSTARFPPAAPRSTATAPFPPSSSSASASASGAISRTVGVTPPVPSVESDLAMSTPTPPPTAENPWQTAAPEVHHVNGNAKAGGAGAGFLAPDFGRNGSGGSSQPNLSASAESFDRRYIPGGDPAAALPSVKSRRAPWGSVAILLLAALSAAAAVVHYKVLPLEVAVIWFKPASLSISSNPSGATVTLDGRLLPDKTPATVEVRRDRAEHAIELSHAGFLAVRTTMRFDQTVALSRSIDLPALPPPPPPPVEAAPTAAPAETAPLQAQKAETEADTKPAQPAGKTAGKTAANATKKASKRAKAADRKASNASNVSNVSNVSKKAGHQASQKANKRVNKKSGKKKKGSKHKTDSSELGTGSEL